MTLVPPPTANEGTSRIQYECLVQISVYQEMKLPASLFPKHTYNVLSLNFHMNVSMSDLYIPMVSLPRNI
jgi:hypothetical protein